MNEETSAAQEHGIRRLPRNVWAVSLTSFLTDVSSEMVINIVPLFLSNILGVKTNIIGVIEGFAEATASILKLFSGWLSDKMRQRKWLAVLGYGISAFSKPFFYFANSWGVIAAVRWADRVGKGIRTAPRDALVADSVHEKQRGLAFGLHRAADTAGAVIGLLIALIIVWLSQSGSVILTRTTFQLIVLISLPFAFLAVFALAGIAKDVPIVKERPLPKFALRSLGRNFVIFMIIVGIFDLGNSSDAFLVLRAQERGLSVMGVLAMLITFNIIYTLGSTPFGALSDRIGRRKVIIGGWLLYGLVYLGFALAQTGIQVWVLYAIYGLYYALTYGTTRAMIADIVKPELLGTAYGTYNAILGILDFPASVIAGVLWQGLADWQGFGAPAPFYFGGVLAFVAAAAMLVWNPHQTGGRVI